MIYSIRNNAKRLLPIVLFISVWIIVLGQLQLKTYPIITPKESTYLVLFLGLFSTIFGYLFSFSLRTNIKSKTYYELDYSKLYWINLALLALASLGILLVFRDIGRMAGDSMIFFKNPYKVRVIVTSVGTTILYTPSIYYKLGSYLVNLGIISTFTSAFLLADKKFRLSAYLPLLVGLLSSLLFFSRYLLVTYVLFFLVASYYSTEGLDVERKHLVSKRLKRTILITILFTVLSLAGIIIARNFYLDKFSDFLAKQIFYYLSGGVSALDQYLTFFHNELNNGFSLTRSLNSWLIKFDLIDTNVPVGSGHAFIKVAPNVILNTYTFIKTIYHDFGLYGAIIIPFFWGFLTSYFVDQLILKFSVIKLFIVSILTFSFIMSFFGFYLESISPILFRFFLILALSLALKVFANYKVITTSI